jgi:hypothetical protein
MVLDFGLKEVHVQFSQIHHNFSYKLQEQIHHHNFSMNNYKEENLTRFLAGSAEDLNLSSIWLIIIQLC